jgi:hypothetical protein
MARGISFHKEEKPLIRKGPVKWFLMTGEPVSGPEEAYEYAGYYVRRWKIERFHYVLKSGCAVENPQERSMDKTITFILMCSIIAVMILNITYAARLVPAPPCSPLLVEDAWKLLYCAANKTMNSVSS